MFRPEQSIIGLIQDSITNIMQIPHYIYSLLILQFYCNYTGCPTRYGTRHFFNNSNTNEDIAKKFEKAYVRCVRNEEEWSVVCVCSAPNCCDTEQRSASQPGSVASGTPCIFGDRIPVAARFSAPVQTSPGAHPASYTLGTSSLPMG
jgi:hypothetical protein